MFLSLISGMIPQLPWAETVSLQPRPFLPPGSPFFSLFFLPRLEHQQVVLALSSGSGRQPCSHSPLPALTFVTLGSLRAGWAWWSLQVESKRTGAWRPTTQCSQWVGEAPAESLGRGSSGGDGGAQHLPEPDSPGRPRSPEGHSREGTVSCAHLPLPMPHRRYHLPPEAP